MLEAVYGRTTRKNAVASIKANADRQAANVLPIIREIQKTGASALGNVADALNARGLPTARGGKWYAASAVTPTGTQTPEEVPSSNFATERRPGSSLEIDVGQFLSGAVLDDEGGLHGGGKRLGRRMSRP